MMFSYIVVLCLAITSTLAREASLTPLLPRLRSIPDALKKLLTAAQPLLDVIIYNNLPASVGDCTAGAPEPCQENGPLFSFRKLGIKATGDWIGGTDTIAVQELVIDSLNGSTISVYFDITMEEMPVQLNIAHCGPKKCRTFLKNTITCCGNTPRHIRGLLHIPCTSLSSPYLGSPVLDYVNIFPDVTITPFGNNFSVGNITSNVQNAVQNAVADLITVESIKTLNYFVKTVLGLGPFTCETKGDN